VPFHRSSRGWNPNDGTTKSPRDARTSEPSPSDLSAFVVNCLSRSRIEFRLEQPDDLADIGEPADSLLGEYQLAPIFNLENTTTRPNEFGVNPQLVLQFLRQTGCLRSVASRLAIGDLADFHDKHTSPSKFSLNPESV
jgi:hypothetical protein